MGTAITGKRWSVVIALFCASNLLFNAHSKVYIPILKLTIYNKCASFLPIVGQITWSGSAIINYHTTRKITSYKLRITQDIKL